MAGRVDKVEQIGFAITGFVFQRHGLCLDGNPPLPLKVHRVQHLLLHFTVAQTTAYLDKTVSNGGLAMVDMGDDRKVTYIIHSVTFLW